jgi:hypothetical protein
MKEIGLRDLRSLVKSHAPLSIALNPDRAASRELSGGVLAFLDMRGCVSHEHEVRLFVARESSDAELVERNACRARFGLEEGEDCGAIVDGFPNTRSRGSLR